MADWKSPGLFHLPVETDGQKLHALATLLVAPTLEIMQFAAEVIEGKTESVVVRFETCRLIQDVDWDDCKGTGLCAALIKVLPDDDDDIVVRQWAAYILYKCQDNPKIVEIAVNLLLSEIDLQWNVVAALEECEVMSPGMRLALSALINRNDLEDGVRDELIKLLSTRA